MWPKSHFLAYKRDFKQKNNSRVYNNQRRGNRHLLTSSQPAKKRKRVDDVDFSQRADLTHIKAVFRCIRIKLKGGIRICFESLCTEVGFQKGRETGFLGVQVRVLHKKLDNRAASETPHEGDCKISVLERSVV
jgi:hypothetical protein